MLELHAGKNIRVKPYGLTSGSRVTTRPMAGDVQGGVDVKYGVASGLVWDFTVNTDCAQVEADEQPVNLTRFNLFFPEKRDFFSRTRGSSTLARRAAAATSAPVARTRLRSRATFDYRNREWRTSVRFTTVGRTATAADRSD